MKLTKGEARNLEYSRGYCYYHHVLFFCTVYRIWGRMQSDDASLMLQYSHFRCMHFTDVCFVKVKCSLPATFLSFSCTEFSRQFYFGY